MSSAFTTRAILSPCEPNNACTEDSADVGALVPRAPQPWMLSWLGASMGVSRVGGWDKLFNHALYDGSENFDGEEVKDVSA